MFSEPLPIRDVCALVNLSVLRHHGINGQLLRDRAQPLVRNRVDGRLDALRLLLSIGRLLLPRLLLSKELRLLLLRTAQALLEHGFETVCGKLAFAQLAAELTDSGHKGLATSTESARSAAARFLRGSFQWAYRER